MKNITKWEIGIIVFLALWFLFNAINVNQALGFTYALFAAFTAIFILTDTKRVIPFLKENDNFLAPILIGAIAYIVLILLGTYVVVPTVTGIIELLGATTPVLSDSATLNFITFGQAVPIGETYFFFIALFDIGLTLFGLDYIFTRSDGWKSKGIWGLIIAIAFIFMVFHLTSKGITNVEVLTLVFFMAIISLVLVLVFKRGADAVFLHIIANTTVLIPVIASIFKEVIPVAVTLVISWV